MKILCIDIETTPNLAHVWGLWQQNVGLNQLLASTEMMCFAAKWVGAPGISFYSVHHHTKQEMVVAAWELLNEADVVMHFNGKRFDIPHLNREFLEMELLPPSPYKQIDLLTVARKQFNFPSNKLAYVSKRLKLSGKTQHEGHELWIKCMAGEEKAWRKMRVYNKQDVRLLEQMYEILQPWIPGHPNAGLYADDSSGADVCPACGGANLLPQGFAITSTSRFQRWQCADCGKWSRSGKRSGFVDLREVIA